MNLIQKFFINDVLRIMRLLPSDLRLRIHMLFLMMFFLAFFEVLSIISMSFVAISVAAPQILLDDSIVQYVLKSSPYLKTLCSDLRYFTLVAASGVVLLVLIKNMLAMLVGWKGACVGEYVSIYFGTQIMHHYLNSDYMWHISSSSGDMFQAMGWRSHLSQLLVSLLNVYTYFITSVALFFALITATPGVILSCLVGTGFIAWTVYRSMKKAIDHSGQQVATSTVQENKTVMSAMNGIREVLIYRQQPMFYNKYLEACRSGVHARAFLSVAPPIPAWILEVFGFMAIPSTVWLLISNENAPMPEIATVVTMVMLASWRILPLMNRSLSCLVAVKSSRAMAMNCLTRLEVIHQQNILPQPKPDPNFKYTQSIQLKNISFRYPNARNLSLSGIDITVSKGVQLGIIGSSGAGKSTLVGIISGLMKAESGDFLIDGKTLTPAGTVAYRLRVGYVPQSPYIMSGTIAENVAFSQWGKPYDAEKVLRACRMAALDLVDNDPRGIQYPIGEQGAGLSGGQAQRVSIARALYVNPEILILDESTSSLDSGTESSIMETINSLKRKLTVIIIAHRLSTVEQCDSLVWIKDGTVKMQGTPENLLQHYHDYISDTNNNE